MHLPDIQDEPDRRGIELDKVGVAGVRYPIHFADGSTAQGGVASVDVSVRLPAGRRGTHMSRMLELIHEHLREFDPRELPTVLKAAANRLDVEGVQLSIFLPIAFEVLAPESAIASWQASDVSLIACIDGGDVQVETTVHTDVTSLCPCSKAISDYGAHNQRSRVGLAVLGASDDVYPIPVRRLFDMIREVGSTPVFPIIKRVDERVVTMRAHDNPAFVEDMARDLSAACREIGVAHRVAVRNFESIHSHDAIASVRWPLRGLD
jgi:GTP cyclohydrolase I